MNVATHILLATDFSEASSAATAKAGELARRLDAKLTVFHAHRHPPEPPEAVVSPERLIWSEDLDAEALEGLEKLRSTELADIEGIVLAVAEDGIRSHAIYDYAAKHDVDLIVMGSHGRTGLAHFFHGSAATQVVKHAPCAVLVVPNAEVTAAS